MIPIGRYKNTKKLVKHKVEPFSLILIYADEQIWEDGTDICGSKSVFRFYITHHFPDGSEEGKRNESRGICDSHDALL